MTIVITTPFFNATGGISTYVSQLSEGYKRHGHDVYIMSSDIQAPRGINLPVNPLVKFFSFFNKLINLRPSFIHVHSQLHMLIPALAYRFANSKVKVAFTFHTQPYIAPALPNSALGKPTYHGVVKILAQILLSRCDFFTAVSKSIFENIQKTCGINLNHGIVIPSGVNPYKYTCTSEAARKKWGVFAAGPVLTTVGVLAWDWKVAGHKLSIEAMPRILNEFHDAILLIAGNTDGRYYEYLKSIVDDLGLNKNVVFLGDVKRVDELLCATDVYVHMALYEASPIAVLEAMSSGKPVVAVRSGGIPGVITHMQTGLLVNPDPASLAEAVIEIYKNKPLANSLGESAQACSLRFHNWDYVSAQYLSVV